jgi:hypothetical protein
VATPRSPDSIRVSWDPPAQAKGKITKFKLLYYMIGETQEHKIEVCSKNQNKGGKCYLLDRIMEVIFA